MPTTFDNAGQRFNYRVAGVFLRGRQVLLHQCLGADYWTLPGGRPELREPSPLALLRELREELNVEASVERLLWFVESFFDFDDLAWHEISLVYRCQLPADSIVMSARGPFLGHEPNGALRFEWVALADLTRRKLYPEFLSTGLLDLPTETKHIIDDERRVRRTL